MTLVHPFLLLRLACCDIAAADFAAAAVALAILHTSEVYYHVVGIVRELAWVAIVIVMVVLRSAVVVSFGYY